MYSFKGFAEDKKFLTGSIVVAAIVAMGCYRWYKPLSKEDATAEELPVLKALKVSGELEDPALQELVNRLLFPYFDKAVSTHGENILKTHSIVPNSELRKLYDRLEQQDEIIKVIIGQIVDLNGEQANQGGITLALAKKVSSVYGWSEEDELCKQKCISLLRESFFKALRNDTDALGGIKVSSPGTNDTMRDYLEKLIVASSHDVGSSDGFGAADEVAPPVMEVVGMEGLQVYESTD